MKFIACFCIILILCGCNSLPKRKLVSHPSWEDSINQLAVNTLLKIEKDKSKSQLKLDLASIYLASYSLETRKKATPILKSLSEEGNVEAIELIVSNEIFGRTGELSIDTYKKNYELLEKRKPELTKRYDETLARSNWVLTKFPVEVTTFYNENYSLCEQPLSDSHSSLNLKNESANLLVMYLKKCLKKYSTNKPGKRLNALAYITKITCRAESNRKRCLDVGFESLANGSFNEKYAMEIGMVLYDFYEMHKYQLKPSQSYSAAGFSNHKHYRAYLKAIELSTKQEYEISVRMLKDYLLNNPELTGYDKASFQDAIATTLTAIDFDKNVDAIIYYWEQIHRNRGLGYDRQSKVLQILMTAYIKKDDFQRLSKIVAEQFLIHQKNRQFLPNDSLRKMLLEIDKVTEIKFRSDI
jgi:hypothetical protein